MAGKYFYPRGEFARVGLNKVALDFLDHVSALLNDRLTIATHDTDLTALAAAIAPLQAAVALALLQAEQVELKIPAQMSREEVLAITDTALLTEDGDYLLTEAGDRILLET